ncbi:MAG: thioredoxin fold domain-containing protein [Gammaproteobacteria bacterium]|nr:thioredoxin fold domain-containing protein [Gammaproteobacteria bacterium]
MKNFTFMALLYFAATASFAESDGRWFSSDQVKRGEVLFKQNCAACHGQNAEKTIDWKKTDANGKYPPPPLNGTAHAWHHSLELLKSTIREGGKKLGGVMPAFEGKLSDTEIDQLVAYFQSKWPDDVYQKWAERFEVSELPSISEVVQTNEKSSLTRHLRKRLGQFKLGEPTETAADDVWQVKFQDRFLYLIEGGKFAIIGDLIDLESGQNLTEISRRDLTIEEIAKYPESDLVIFEPEGEVKATLDIFTDTSCGYCRKLHKELPKLTGAGIRIRYFPYARGGEQGPGYATLKSVWCAKDRLQAMTDAKNEITHNLPAGDCEAAKVVDQGYITGSKVGITGTPALFKKNGEKIIGYVPYQKLIPMVLN